jgi:hypothetical protein
MLLLPINGDVHQEVTTKHPMPKEPNFTNYKFNGPVNGLGSHSWNCLGCNWTHSVLGGRLEQNRGQRKADSHACYNSSNDSWKQRKDLE